MKPVKVVWFNENKNFGQGETDKGETVFLPGTALVYIDLLAVFKPWEPA